MKRSKNSQKQPESIAGANHQKQLARINRIQGQVAGIGRMVEQQAHCPDIITQIQAVRSALASLQASILQGHLEHCVKQALKKTEPTTANELIAELVGIFKHNG